MRIEFERDIELDSDVETTWEFFADVRRVVGCIPNISEFTDVGNGRYTAVGSDRVGPFRVGLAVEIDVSLEPTARAIAATITGHDRKSGTRMTGSLRASCKQQATRSAASVTAEAEVLGPVATLGAGPIRRRMDDIFKSFVTCAVTEIQSATGSTD